MKVFKIKKGTCKECALSYECKKGTNKELLFFLESLGLPKCTETTCYEVDIIPSDRGEESTT